MNKGEGMKNERVEKFKGLFAMYEECKHKGVFPSVKNITDEVN